MKSVYTALLLILLAGSLRAQPVSDANGLTTTGNIVSSLTISSFSVPANNNRLLIACTANASNAAPPTLTFAGNPMTAAITRSTTSGLVVGLYYITLGSSGSATVGNIVASGTSLLQLGAASYWNADQMDTHGGFEYSPLVVIRSGGNGTLLLYPNPAGDAIFYQYDDLEAVRRIQLYDATGKLMLETTQIDGRFSLNGLPAGLYWLTLQTHSGVIQQQVWKN